MEDEALGGRVGEALSLYPLANPAAKLIRHNENATYRVTDGKDYVLRIHKPVGGFNFGIFDATAHSAERLREELAFLSSLRDTLRVQSPVPTLRGGAVGFLGDGTPVTLLTWLEGESLERVEITEEILTGIGEMVAGMHACSMKIGGKMNRYAYDQTMLPLISRNIVKAREAALITPAQCEAILGAVREIGARMDEMDSKGIEKGMVHSDLARSNMIAHSGGVSPIDFCLSGTSHYYMDIGSLFGHFSERAQRETLVRSYESRMGRSMDERYIEPYFALQIILFLASQYERSREWAWFGDAVERWRGELFIPLQERKAFL